MQRSVRVNDAQLILLAERASGDNGSIRVSCVMGIFF